VDDAHRCYIAADALDGIGFDVVSYGHVRKWLESSRELPLGEACEVLDEDQFDRKRSYREANIPGIGHLIFKLRPDAKDPTRHTLCRVYRVE
jgi:hypothetical protein